MSTLEVPGANTNVGTLERMDTFLGQPYNVVLFNDSKHDVNAVIAQIIKAVKCSDTAAKSFVHTVEQEGSAVVYYGNLETCEHVEFILSGPPLQLRTAINPA